MDTTCAKVSIVGAGMQSHSGVASKMFEAMSNNNINIKMISTSAVSYTHLDVYKRQFHKRVCYTIYICSARKDWFLPGWGLRAIIWYCSCLLYTSRCV